MGKTYPTNISNQNKQEKKKLKDKKSAYNNNTLQKTFMITVSLEHGLRKKS